MIPSSELTRLGYACAIQKRYGDLKANIVIESYNFQKKPFIEIVYSSPSNKDWEDGIYDAMYDEICFHYSRHWKTSIVEVIDEDSIDSIHEFLSFVGTLSDSGIQFRISHGSIPEHFIEGIDKTRDWLNEREREVKEHFKQIAKKKVEKLLPTTKKIADEVFQGLGYLFSLIDKTNVREYSKMCIGTLPKSRYTCELARLKIATEKLMKASPDVMEFADLFSSTKEALSTVIEYDEIASIQDLYTNSSRLGYTWEVSLYTSEFSIAAASKKWENEANIMIGKMMKREKELAKDDTRKIVIQNLFKAFPELNSAEFFRVLFDSIDGKPWSKAWVSTCIDRSKFQWVRLNGLCFLIESSLYKMKGYKWITQVYQNSYSLSEDYVSSSAVSYRYNHFIPKSYEQEEEFFSALSRLLRLCKKVNREKLASALGIERGEVTEAINFNKYFNEKYNING